VLYKQLRPSSPSLEGPTKYLGWTRPIEALLLVGPRPYQVLSPSFLSFLLIFFLYITG